jgi:small subunit ribosomal protein S1
MSENPETKNPEKTQKPKQPESQAETTKQDQPNSTEEVKKDDQAETKEEVQPEEQVKPKEETQPEEQEKPQEEAQPEEQEKPQEEAQPEKQEKSQEEAQPEEQEKPQEEIQQQDQEQIPEEAQPQDQPESQPVTEPAAAVEEPKPEPTPPSAPISSDEERVIPLSELKDENEYDAEEMAFMLQLYEETMQQIKSGEIIAGKIVSISDREVAIDIGFKSEGTVPIEEFEEPADLTIGDTIEVYLENIENQDGQLVLSKRKADFARVWNQIMETYERGETVKGRCTRRIKGGIVVDVTGIDAFLPGSQIDIHPVRDFDSWIGQICDFRIVKVNEARKNIVLSRKVLIEENLRDVREKILSEIQIGEEIDGIVKNITDFGAFVDLGGVDGLLHITDISWGRVNHPSEVVSYDENLKVRVLDFDPVRKRISVGLKQLFPHPWEGVEERYPVNSKVTGRVVSITKYGAFVELEEGIEGLIHISEMSWTQHIKHPSQILNIGQDVEVVVLSIDAENRKVSLGLKQTEEDPWEKLEQKYAVETKHKGAVRDLVPFGAFVELEEGVEGLVHISDLSWTRKVRHPGEVVKKGDEIEVTVLSFDRNERRIALGHKQTIENPWDLFETKYPVGTEIGGKVVRTVDKGAIVELEWSLESFLPVSHFGKDSETGRSKALKEGEELQIEVIDFDKDSKKIVVSALNIQKRTENAEYKEYLEEQKAEAEVEAPAEKVETGEKEPAAKGEAEAEKPAEEAKAVAEAPTEVEVKEEKPKAEPAAEEAPIEAAKAVAEKAEIAEVEEVKESKPTKEKKPKKAAGKKAKADAVVEEKPKKAAGKKAKAEAVVEEKPKKVRKAAKKDEPEEEKEEKPKAKKKTTTKKKADSSGETKAAKKPAKKAKTTKAKPSKKEGEKKTGKSDSKDKAEKS